MGSQWRVNGDCFSACGAVVSGRKARGAIFDMDGVLVDTLPIHQASWQELAEQHGHPFSRDAFLAGNGSTAQEHIEHIYRWSDDPDVIRYLVQRKETLYWSRLADIGVAPVGGVVAVLRQLQEMGIPRAVGTSASQENMHRILKKVGLESYFSVFVSSSEVVRGKPAPDIFLKAAQRLEIAPQDCIVFEDAPLGIEAAKAAGMRVIAVATTHPADQLSHADQVIESFDQLPLADWF